MKSKEELYEAVKFVEGENSVTIEETHNLTSTELVKLTDSVIEHPNYKNLKSLTILLNDSFPDEVERHLYNRNFKCHDELLFVKKDFKNLEQTSPVFTLKSLREVTFDHFKSIWERAMKGSLNAPSLLDMDEQMRGVEKELGSTYIDTCILAFEGERAIGVIMPHIEPGTEAEGRIFYFGLVPEARGKRKAVQLYKQGLDLLNKQFGATYSIGATSKNNKPMLRVFEETGFEITERVKVYKRSHRSLKS
ncbi:GNAT family N-acetyltransferase [Halobacillus sp. H74]|uniref:GNAT family N-acetyltransferase n=1 Tax=Halobacillus sp. H74 TaxID=3457436 RepID=UPI003FCECAEF